MASIRMWRIVPQTVTVKGVEMEVLCRQVRWFPYKDKKTGKQKFGQLKNQIWQVLIQRANWVESGSTWAIRFSNGKWSIICGYSYDKADPWDRRKEPGTVTKITHDYKGLSTDRILDLLNDKVRDGSNMPDTEFIEALLEMMIDHAEGTAQAA